MAWCWLGTKTCPSRTMKTYGDLITVMGTIKTPEDAQAFQAAYREVEEYADQNIGFALGEFGPEDFQRLQALFKVGHPIFGTAYPAPLQAFESGAAMGRARGGDREPVPNGPDGQWKDGESGQRIDS